MSLSHLYSPNFTPRVIWLYIRLVLVWKRGKELKSHLTSEKKLVGHVQHCLSFTKISYDCSMMARFLHVKYLLHLKKTLKLFYSPKATNFRKNHFKWQNCCNSKNFVFKFAHTVSHRSLRTNHALNSYVGCSFVIAVFSVDFLLFFSILKNLSVKITFF